MAAATCKHYPAWQAELTWERRFIPMTEASPEGETEAPPEGTTGELREGETEVTFLKVWNCLVIVWRSEDERIRFRVNHRKGRSLTVTDPRLSGRAGITGIWGTLPAPPAPRPRVLSLTEFQSILAGFVGAERAKELVRTIRSLFCDHLRQLSDTDSRDGPLPIDPRAANPPRVRLR